jgi:hypothetical protein
MRRCSWLAVVALGLVPAWATVAADHKPKEKVYRFDVKVLEGDPLGNRQDKTQEILTQPQVLAYEKQESDVEVGQFVLLDGEQVFFGARLKIKPERGQDGTIRLSMVFEYTEVISEKEDALKLQTNQARYIRSVKPGEILRLKIGKMGKAADGQRWVELSAIEVDPDNWPCIRRSQRPQGLYLWALRGGTTLIACSRRVSSARRATSASRPR